MGILSSRRRRSQPFCRELPAAEECGWAQWPGDKGDCDACGHRGAHPERRSKRARSLGDGDRLSCCDLRRTPLARRSGQSGAKQAVRGGVRCQRFLPQLLAATRATRRFDTENLSQPLFGRERGEQRLRRADAEQFADQGKLVRLVSVGQKAVVPNPREPIGQDVREEATDELIDRKGQRLAAIAVGPVAVRERRDEPRKVRRALLLALKPSSSALAAPDPI